MPKNILITGASGLLGTRLTELLLQKVYQVSHLSRSKSEGPIPTFTWNVAEQEIESEALDQKDAIIHLAGAGIADKRWTVKRKKEILDSRVKSTELLFEALKREKHQVKTFVSASAIGIYGFAGSEIVFDEDSEPADDFLAAVVKEWETAVDKIESLGIRVVKIRIGILLSEQGGALKEMMQPIKWGVGSPLGSGKQFLSWIHIDDVCQMFMKAIEDELMHGGYNAVGPNPATNKELTIALAKVLKKPLLLPNVPSFILKIVLGEMADLVLKGSKVSSDKIQKAGHKFLFPKLEEALRDLLLIKTN
ncbi:MAG TPA: TIGR01777 family oxidoreductase [Cyclobacteriaceae bacterium]